MPLYNWQCPKCGKRTRRLLVERPKEDVLCQDDGAVLESLTKGSTSVMEVLDNGIMPKRVERYRDAVELRKQHAGSTTPKDESII